MKTYWKLTYLTVSFFLAAIASASADTLYDLDFTAPEVGTYQTTSGSPSVQSSVGTLSSALVFDAVTSYEQIRLPIDVVGPRYDIHFDLLVHGLLDSQYAFGAILDTPEVRTIDVHGGTNSIYVFQPFGGGTLSNSFSNDRVYHFDISIDFPANRWTVAIDGTERYSKAINASRLDALRFFQ